jgi:hypothetical protein
MFIGPNEIKEPVFKWNPIPALPVAVIVIDPPDVGVAVVGLVVSLLAITLPLRYIPPAPPDAVIEMLLAVD